jgi:hypothetical protein
MPFEYQAQRNRRQHTLVGFLQTELQLGPTFAQSAALAKGAGHMDHYTAAREKAMRVAQTVRRFMRQVADEQIRREIRKKLAELDDLISTL